MKFDEKQGLLKFTPDATPKASESQVNESKADEVVNGEPKEVIQETEKISCQYCEDVGFCNYCARGKQASKERADANIGKQTKDNKFYAKRRWKFKTK